MSSSSSRAKIAAVSVAILGAATAVFLLRQGPPTAPVSNEPKAELSQLVAAASPPPRVVASSIARQKPARAPTTATRPAETSPVPRAVSFDVPDCRELTLVSVTDGTATLQTGESEPEQVRVGDLLEGGEVTFVGKHPESGEPIVLLEDDANVSCRAVVPKPLAALARIGPTSARDLASRSVVTGDPHRVETMALKLPAGTNAARADFGSAARRR